MGIYSWDLDDGSSEPVRLTVHCEYPDQPPTEVTFRLSPSYGLTTGHEANEWFLEMMLSARGVRSRNGSGRGAAAFILV